MAKKKVPCYRCDAVGHIPHYAHIANGVCFLCGGTKLVTDYGRRPGGQGSPRPPADLRAEADRRLNEIAYLLDVGDKVRWDEGRYEKKYNELFTDAVMYRIARSLDELKRDLNDPRADRAFARVLERMPHGWHALLAEQIAFISSPEYIRAVRFGEMTPEFAREAAENYGILLNFY